MDELTLIKKLEEIRASTLLGTKEVFNTDEACMFLGVGKQCLYRMVRERIIPYFKSKGGKLTYFKKRDLEEWMLCTPIRSKAQIKGMASAM